MPRPPVALSLCAVLASACASSGGGPTPQNKSYRGGDAQSSRAQDAVMVVVGEGAYLAGSTREERDAAYDDYNRTAGHDGARKNKWFEREADRTRRHLAPFRIDLTPVSMAAYAEFIDDTDRAAPTMDAVTWKQQGFIQDYQKEVVRYVWQRKAVPKGRAMHPVVLVSWADANAYCEWRGEVVGQPRRLPTDAEYEKAARGPGGNNYPWGTDFDPAKLNSAVGGPRDLVAVGSIQAGASPFGVLGLAGNVFQWTSTPWPHRDGAMTVKGSAWEDYAGVGRGAAKHGRLRTIRHAIVGFRCAADPK